MGPDGNMVEELPGGGHRRSIRYSSIMDYGFQFNTDLRGIGKLRRGGDHLRLHDRL
jgi:hypothetical protein